MPDCRRYGIALALGSMLPLLPAAAAWKPAGPEVVAASKDPRIAAVLAAATAR